MDALTIAVHTQDLSSLRRDDFSYRDFHIFADFSSAFGAIEMPKKSVFDGFVTPLVCFCSSPREEEGRPTATSRFMWLWFTRLEQGPYLVGGADGGGGSGLEVTATEATNNTNDICRQEISRQKKTLAAPITGPMYVHGLTKHTHTCLFL